MSKRGPVRYLILTILVGVLLFVLGCSASGDNDITGSGVLETRKVEYADFTQLALSQGFQAYITQADSFSVGLTMDDNMYDYLDIKQMEGKLYIGLKGGSYRDFTAKVNITMPELDSLELTAASTAELTDFRMEDPLGLELRASSIVVFSNVQAGSVQCMASGSSIVFGRIEMEDASFEIVASSTAQLQGSAKTMSLDVISASVANLAEFDVVDMNIEVTAASRGTVNVSGTLDLGVHSNSYLKYLGSPDIGEHDVTGGSVVEKG
jgi:Putative auto-transporter adhesin, head GIN domain